MARSSRVAAAVAASRGSGFLPDEEILPSMKDPADSPVLFSPGENCKCHSTEYAHAEEVACELAGKRGRDTEEWKSVISCIRHLAAVADEQEVSLKKSGIKTIGLSPARIGSSVLLSDGRSGVISALPERWRKGYIFVRIDSNDSRKSKTPAYVTDVAHISLRQQGISWRWPGEVIDPEPVYTSSNPKPQEYYGGLSLLRVSDLDSSKVIGYLRENGWSGTDLLYGGMVHLYRIMQPSGERACLLTIPKEIQINTSCILAESIVQVAKVLNMLPMEVLESMEKYASYAVKNPGNSIVKEEGESRPFVSFEDECGILEEAVLEYMIARGWKKRSMVDTLYYRENAIGVRSYISWYKPFTEAYQVKDVFNTLEKVHWMKAGESYTAIEDFWRERQNNSDKESVIGGNPCGVRVWKKPTKGLGSTSTPS